MKSRSVTSLLYLSLLASLNCFGQRAIKDTVIDSTTFHYAHYNMMGKLVAFSQNKTKSEGGMWMLYHHDGSKNGYGMYNTNGNKDGIWKFYRNESMIYTNYKDGKATVSYKRKRYAVFHEVIIN
jgi:hypothetical protein